MLNLWQVTGTVKITKETKNNERYFLDCIRLEDERGGELKFLPAVVSFRCVLKPLPGWERQENLEMG